MCGRSLPSCLCPDRHLASVLPDPRLSEAQLVSQSYGPVCRALPRLRAGEPVNALGLVMRGNAGDNRFCALIALGGVRGEQLEQPLADRDLPKRIPGGNGSVGVTLPGHGVTSCGAVRVSPGHGMVHGRAQGSW